MTPPNATNAAPPSHRKWEYTISLAVVAICTVVSLLLHPYLPEANLIMIYLIGVVAIASRCHRNVAMAASLASVAAFDFFCVEPYLSFVVTSVEYLVTLVVMLAVALLISEMTSRIRMQAAAAAEREVRVRTESMRTSLLSAVSHDLRTPLSSIAGAASTLRAHWSQLDAQMRDNLLENVTEETDRLNRLLHNLIQATRLEAGVELNQEWYPLEEVIGAALHRLQRQISGRSIKTNVPSSLPMIAMDDVLMEQVVINLVENALKYTSPDSPVEISACRLEGFVEVQVRDRGPGFSGNEDRVFDRFFRGQTDNVRGAGLGLTICRAIVEAHGGSIRAENHRLGGAIVRFTLPLKEPPPRVAAMELSAS